MAGFLVGQAMHSLMGRQGFGAFGNMIILAIGFYLGLTLHDHSNLGYSALEVRFAIGIAGAFLSLFAAALLKRVLLDT